MENSTSVSRRTFTAAERQRLVALYHQSQLTQGQFARRHELKLSTLQQWIYRPNKRPVSARPVFKELLLPPAPARAPWLAELTLGADLTVRLGPSATAEFVAQLVNTLRRSC
jgi:hypothetical protein